MSWMHGQSNSSGAYSGYHRPSHVPPQQQTCRFPGCARPCYVESYGRVHDFCGRTHANEFARLYGPSYSMSSGSGASFQRKKPTSTTPGSSSRQPMRAVYQYQSLTGATGHGSNQIRFYNRDEPYYEFTNFYPTNVFIDGKNWPTTEHYFQAQKFVGTPYVEKIRRLPNPRDAFQLSRDPLVSRWRRSDWESVKDNIMLKALRVKFSENFTLRDKLRSTGEKELVEHTSNDSYWGDGGNGLGQNKLGKLLMQVRRELKEKYGPYTSAPPYHFSTRDDSSIHRATSTHTTPRLRRSNSFSNISSSHPSHTSATSYLLPGGTSTGSGQSRSYSGAVGQTWRNPPKQSASIVPSPKAGRRNSNSGGSTNNVHKATSAAKKAVGTVKQGFTKAVSALPTTVINHKTGSSGSGKSTGLRKTKI